MATLVWQDPLAKQLWEKIHNFASTDVFKMALSNSAIASSAANLAAITEIGAGNGYSAGGPVVTASTSAPATGQGASVFADYTMTASGGSIATFRYGLIYNSSQSNFGICSFDLGAAVSLTVGNSHLFDFSTYALLIS